MYNKIVNPKTGKKVLTTSCLGKSILKKYIAVINKQSGGATAKFGAKSFVNMCDMGSTQCAAICANWLGVERAYIEALLWESRSDRFTIRPDIAFSDPGERADWGVGGGVLDHVLRQYKETLRGVEDIQRRIERGEGLNVNAGHGAQYLESGSIMNEDYPADVWKLFKSFMEKNIKIVDIPDAPISYEWYGDRVVGGRPMTLSEAVAEIGTTHLEGGEATILNITRGGTGLHFAIIGKFNDGRLFIIDPQVKPLPALFTGASPAHAMRSIHRYLLSLGRGYDRMNIGILTGGPKIDTTNYTPELWPEFGTQATTGGYHSLPKELRLCARRAAGGPCDLSRCEYSPCVQEYATNPHTAQADYDRTIQSRACGYYASGTCRFGDQCRFSHDIGGAASKSSAMSAAAVAAPLPAQASPVSSEMMGGKTPPAGVRVKYNLDGTIVKGTIIDFDEDGTWSVMLDGDDSVTKIPRERLDLIQGGGKVNKTNYIEILEEISRNHNDPEFIKKVLPVLGMLKIKIL